MDPAQRLRVRTSDQRAPDFGPLNVVAPAHTAHPRKVLDEDVRMPHSITIRLPRARENDPAACRESSSQPQEVSRKSWGRHVHSNHMPSRARNASWSIRKCARRARCTCQAATRSGGVVDEFLRRDHKRRHGVFHLVAESLACEHKRVVLTKGQSILPDVESTTPMRCSCSPCRQSCA